ncbi:MAG: amidase [Hyphomicrobiaceae bacterium]
MKLAEYAAHDATGLADLVARKEVSPKELARTALSAIGAVNGDLNAVIELYDDQIDDLDVAKLGTGPFHGVPFLIKDVFGHLKGRRIEFGSRLCEGMIGDVETNFAKLVKSSGFNILGRTNTPEYSLSSTTENLLYGNTHNPWKRGHSAGGSTGGGAAAVASGMVPVAHGSDIGGSIRIPASWCGGVGLKPSRGRISFGPSVDEGGWGMAMNFVQSRTMRDTARILDCLSVPQPGDPFVLAKPVESYESFLEGETKPLRIAYTSKALMKNGPVDAEVAAAVEATARTLQGMGHSVTEDSFPFDIDDLNTKFLDVWFFGFDLRLEGYAKRTGRKIGPETLETVTLELYDYARCVDAQRFLSAVTYMNSVRRTIGEFFSRYDIWLTPATVQVAPKHGLYGMNRDETAEEHISAVERPCQYPLPFNVSGAPALSLPLAMHSSGLPIGVQLGARPAEEHLLIALGAKLEEAMPWRDRQPGVHVAHKG